MNNQYIDTLKSIGAEHAKQLMINRNVWLGDDVEPLDGDVVEYIAKGFLDELNSINGNN